MTAVILDNVMHIILGKYMQIIYVFQTVPVDFSAQPQIMSP